MAIRLRMESLPALEFPPPASDLPHPVPMDSSYRVLWSTPKDAPPGVKARMLALYESLYELPSAGLFWKDLEAKEELLLLWQGDDLVGFTSVVRYGFAFEGTTYQVVFSGDTVVDRAHWGQQALALAWIRRAGAWSRERLETPTVWFLVVKGHRTFRYLPAFCHRFHPHWQHPEGAWRRLADALARDRYGAAYDQARGVVSFPESHGHLRPEAASPSEAERQQPAVAYFLDRNPGYAHGDELVCLVPLSPDFLRPLARRYFMGPA